MHEWKGRLNYQSEWFFFQVFEREYHNVLDKAARLEY